MLAEFIGDWRMRTPVASKNAFAIAPAIAAVGGSPEPVSTQSLANAFGVALAHVDVRRRPSRSPG